MTRPRPMAVLLDRDGVLNVDLDTSVLSTDQLFLVPESAEAVALMKHLGFLVIVVTNQACVGRGELSRVELNRIHDQLVSEVRRAGGGLDGFFVCTHAESDRCECRKPKPGLLLEAGRTHHLSLPRTWLVGDDLRDVDAARNAGARPALVRTGKGWNLQPPPGVAVFSNLMHFATELAEGRLG